MCADKVRKTRLRNEGIVLIIFNGLFVLARVHKEEKRRTNLVQYIIVIISFFLRDKDEKEREL